jgi:hypothetical protein
VFKMARFDVPPSGDRIAKRNLEFFLDSYKKRSTNQDLQEGSASCKSTEIPFWSLTKQGRILC